MNSKQWYSGYYTVVYGVYFLDILRSTIIPCILKKATVYTLNGIPTQPFILVCLEHIFATLDEPQHICKIV